MSKHLVESIVSNDLLQANDIFEAKLNEIRARKLYELKRMYQAEAFGGLTKAEIDARKKAGYKKAADVLTDPRGKSLKKIPLPDMKKEKKIAEAEGEDKFAGMKPTPLKKDPRGRTLDRLRANLSRYDTLKARGSKTADARMLKIATGYAGKVAKQAVKNTAKGAAASVGRAINSPLGDDLHSIGTRNL